MYIYIYICIYIYIYMYIYISLGELQRPHCDLTATSLESWLIREVIPK